MTPYVSRAASDKNKLLFAQIQTIMRHLPDLDLGVDENGKKVLISCHHMVARAIGNVLGLKVIDGCYAKIYAHSWIMTDDYHFIIDPYPVHALGQIMVKADFGNPGFILYEEKKNLPTLAKLLLFSSAIFRRSVRQLEKEVRRIVIKY